MSTALAACMYTYTWASNEGISDIIHTKTGCATGTPLADLVYVLSISRVMYKLRSTLLEEGLVSAFCVGDTDAQTHMHGVGYVDDTAIPVFSCASDLVRKSSAVAGVTAIVFSSII